MPNLFTVSGYKIYFWANENDEPIHVHIPLADLIFSLESDFHYLPLYSRLFVSAISLYYLGMVFLSVFISAQFFLICSAWKQFFVTDEIKFYC